MKKNYHIATAVDGNYYVPLFVMLSSLFETNKNITFSVHILQNDIADHLQVELTAMTSKYGHYVNWISVDKKWFDNYPTFTYLTIAAYYRTIIPDLIPATVEKILYLDVDIIINDNIEKLLETDMGNMPLMAVKEAIPDFVPRLNIPAKYDYFNTGVLLFNLTEWRKHNYCDQLANLIQNDTSSAFRCDQDIMNVLFHRTISFLHPKWNFQSWHYQLTQSELFERYSVEKDLLTSNPSIIHFTGPSKPWLFLCMHPYKPLFIKYLNKTRHGGFMEQGKIQLRIKKIILRIKYKLEKIFSVRKRPVF